MRTPIVLGLQVLRRASAFLAEEKDVPAKMGSIPKHVEALNGAIARVEKYAREQDANVRSYQAAALATREAARTLLAEHLRPVVLMGELLFPVASPVRVSLKRPSNEASYEVLINAAESIATVVEEHKATFVAAGFREDAVEQIRGAVATLRAAMEQKHARYGSRSAATAGLVESYGRARKMMRLLNAMVVPQLKDADRVAKWKTLSRFVPAVKRNGEEGQGETPAPTAPTNGSSTPEGNKAA